MGLKLKKGKHRSWSLLAKKQEPSSKTKQRKTSQNGQDRIYKTDNTRANIERKEGNSNIERM